MAEVFDPYKFLWWRFSKYELKDAYIRPAPGAKLELYDPWQAYRESWEYDPDSATPWQEKREQNPPYLSLLALADGLDSDSVDINAFNNILDRILEWCSRFGLLGMLPQRVHLVALTPRWFPRKPWGAAVGKKVERPKDGILYPTQIMYCRDSAILMHLEGVKVQGWNPTLWHGSDQGQKGRRIGQIYKERTSTTPGVLIEDMRFATGKDFPSVKVLHTVFQESFQETWARFFPAIPKKDIETYLYPPPLSPPFWEIYSESLSDFFMGLQMLRDALICLNESDEAGEPPDGLSRRNKGVLLLNSLLSSSSMVLASTRSGSFRQEWRAASLLGCFAMMVLQDLTQDKKVIRCEKCNRLFVTEAYQARYCSDTCRHTAQKRRYRQKLKKKESQKNE